MKRNYAVTGTLVALALVLPATLIGCKKEQAKEEAAPTQQAAAPQAAAQPAQPAAAPQAAGTIVAEFNFEDGTQKWYPMKGVKIFQDKTQTHGGNSSLKITGTATKGTWDFAGSPYFDLVPSKHYKFSGWMKVASIKPYDSKTYCWLKVGLYKDKQWVKNVINNSYDFSKKGEWQFLTAEFDAPADSNLTGNFTIDKRPQEKDITGTVYVDDIKIEQTN